MPTTLKNESVLVTGGAGFIGSAVIRELLSSTDYSVVNVDCLSYAGNLATTRDFCDNPRYQFRQLDIRDRDAVEGLFSECQPAFAMHLAAESHVDRSIDGPADFISTNIVGTYNLLEVARNYHQESSTTTGKFHRFHHVSTDEVYGSLGSTGLFTEESPYQPNSPYSASKAASDHLVRARGETYKLPTVVSNCSNNYGPYQFPEKLIPVVISKALAGQTIPVYGAGDNVRDWLYVQDHANALVRIMLAGSDGQTYNVGGNSERSNLEVVETICEILDATRASDTGRSYKDQIGFVTDRPGHDFRYAIDAEKIRRELGWQPRESFESGMQKTVEWYLANQDWVSEVQIGGDNGERLGLGGRT